MKKQEKLGRLPLTISIQFQSYKGLKKFREGKSATNQNLVIKIT